MKNLEFFLCKVSPYLKSEKPGVEKMCDLCVERNARLNGGVFFRPEIGWWEIWLDGETKGRVEWENGLDSTDEKFLFKIFCFSVLRENYSTEDEDLHITGRC